MSEMDGSPESKWSHQPKAIERVREHYRNGVERVCLVAPVGSGKTEMFCRIVRGTWQNGRRCLVLAHRKELIDQASRRLLGVGVPHGIIRSGVPGNSRMPVQVGSIDTVRNRDLSSVTFDLVVVDEAHRVMSESYKNEIARHPGARVLGCTATPIRLDGQGLDDIFQEIVEAATPRELVEAGCLVPLRGHSYQQPNLKGLRSVGGDYALGAAAERMKGLAPGIVEKWKACASDRPTIVFACNRAHGAELVTQFASAGVQFGYLDGLTAEGERERMIEELGTGRLQGIVNVNVLTEGTDIPVVSCIVWARPTKSVALFIQGVGRGRRAAEGKTDCILHDHSGTAVQLGHPDLYERWTLTGTRRPGSGVRLPALGKSCPQCFLVVPASDVRCSECGHVFELRKKKQVDELKNVVEVSLDELIRNPETPIELLRMRLIAEAKRRGYHWRWAEHQLWKLRGIPVPPAGRRRTLKAWGGR